MSIKSFISSVFIILFFFFSFFYSPAQSSIADEFFKLSRPEKIWVFAHPFKAKKAFLITKDVQQDVDSIKRAGTIGNDNNGGKLDAFKHAYWMATLALEIGKRRAEKLGIAHEKRNKIQFKKHQLEENSLPDSVSSMMDLYNNKQGIEAVSKYKNASKKEMQKIIMDALNNGKLRMIKKDLQGNFLNCDGSIIRLQDWYGKWNIPKCLVSSDEG